MKNVLLFLLTLMAYPAHAYTPISVTAPITQSASGSIGVNNATSGAVGVIKPDNSTITISGGVITAVRAAPSGAAGGDLTGTYPNPTIGANKVTLAKLATQATNTVLGNATSGGAVPTALAVGSCSTASSALIWTTNTGFGCNTSITASAVAVGGITGLGTGVATALAVNIGTAGSFIANGGALGTPSSGTATNLTGTATALNIGGSAPASGLTGTTLASGVVTSSLTTVGTIATGVWNAGAITSNGAVTGTSFIATGTTIPANGMYLPAANTLGWATNSTAAITIDSTQRVGIGTASPLTALTVNQSGHTSPSQTSQYGISLVDQGTLSMQFGTDLSYAYIQSWSTKSLSINPEGNNILLVPAGGSVGIGTTTTASLLQTYNNEAKVANYTGALIDVFNTSSTASVNKTGMDIESTGTWTGTSAINTGLVVNATGGTTNYAATFSGGNVGIGSTAPSVALDIVGAAKTTSTITGTGFIPTSSTVPTNGMNLTSSNTVGLAANSLQFFTGTTGTQTFVNASGDNTVFSSSGSGNAWFLSNSTAGTTGLQGNASGTGKWWVGTRGTNTGGMGIWTSSSTSFDTNPILISGAGTITLATVTTGTNADVLCITAGKVVTLQAAASCTISQRKLKENFGPVDDALAIVMKLRPTAFNMKQTSPSNADPNAMTRQIGFIAEDVAQVDTRLSLFENDMKTPKSWRQDGVLALTVKAVQELKADNDNLHREIEALKKRRH